MNRGETAGITGEFVVIAAFKVRTEWDNLTPAVRRRARDELLRLLTQCERSVVIDIYISCGLKASADYFLRVRARDLAEAQDWLGDWKQAAFGRFSEGTETMVGLRKERQYITPEKSPGLDEQLNGAQYQGDSPRFAIIIPVKKDTRWWSLAHNERLREIEMHTQKSLPYLTRVKRELYHSTGLDDMDFITYFETADLHAFHELSVGLATIRENEFHTRWGHPTLLGRIFSVPDAVARLCRRV